MKIDFRNVLGYAITKVSHIVTWFIYIKDRKQYSFETEQVANCIKIMSIAPLIVNTVIRNNIEASSVIDSKIAIKAHEQEVKLLAELVNKTPNINTILTQRGIDYRFIIMDKMKNYFTYKIESNLTIVYISKTFT